jgi:signal peptidase I
MSSQSNVRSRQKRGRAATSAKAASRQSAGRNAVEWIKSIAIGFALFLVLRTFLIQTFRITSGSMEDTLLVGDFLVLSKSAYGAAVPGTDVKLPGYTRPKRNDIIVFRGHHEPIDLVKRLVGMPGDTLEMRQGVLFTNGQQLAEPMAQHLDPGGDGPHPWMTWQYQYLLPATDSATYQPTRDNWGPLVVPASSYFVMGDNRDLSLDSRYWGFVPEKDIKGKALILYFSWDGDAEGVLSHIRWNRIFDVPR